MKLEVGSAVEIEIDALATGGDGIGRVDGCAVFVPMAAPGDRVLAELVQVRRRFARAELQSVLRPGRARRAPVCPWFGRCGGCQWLHLDEVTQVQTRSQILRDSLRCIGRLGDLPTIRSIRSPAALGYRTRARVACARGRVGFRARRSHEIVPIEHCVVLDPAAQQQLERLRADPPRAQEEIEIRSYEKRLEVAGRWLRVSPGSFFQANGSLWETWLATVLDLCGRAAFALELHAGVGFYTAGLEQRCGRVIALERGAAVRDLMYNTSAEVVHAAAETWLPTQVGRITPDLVLMNPPRSGIGREVGQAMKQLAPPRIVYVSCDPSTLARDLARLGTSYSVTQIRSLEAMPQTSHVEAVVLLEHVDFTREVPLEFPRSPRGEKSG